jgi:hypothetical protein
MWIFQVQRRVSSSYLLRLGQKFSPTERPKTRWWLEEALIEGYIVLKETKYIKLLDQVCNRRIEYINLKQRLDEVPLPSLKTGSGHFSEVIHKFFERSICPLTSSFDSSPFWSYQAKKRSQAVMLADTCIMQDKKSTHTD